MAVLYPAGGVGRRPGGIARIFFNFTSFGISSLTGHFHLALASLQSDIDQWVVILFNAKLAINMNIAKRFIGDHISLFRFSFTRSGSFIFTSL